LKDRYTKLRVFEIYKVIANSVKVQEN
jgi:hypothetical protein